MVAMILAWQRDLHVLHHSEGSIIANCSYLGGSVPTLDIKKPLTGILTEQKFISDCRYRVIESSSLVPVLFREVFSHSYISLFHLLVNGFSVIYIYTRIPTRLHYPARLRARVTTT